MNIKIITSQKIKKDFINAGLKEYQKRLSRYCKIKHINIKKIEDIDKHIKEKAYTILVSHRGETISSQGLAHHFNTLGIQGKSEIVLLITPEEISDVDIDMHLSLANIEISSELMTLTLYEQVYRAFTIIHGLPYHK